MRWTHGDFANANASGISIPRACGSTKLTIGSLARVVVLAADLSVRRKSQYELKHANADMSIGWDPHTASVGTDHPLCRSIYCARALWRRTNHPAERVSEGPSKFACNKKTNFFA